MSLQEKLNNDLKHSLKEKSEPAFSTLRMLKSNIQFELTKSGASMLGDEQVLQIIKKNIISRKDTASEYKKANRIDLAEKEELEASFLEGYLPPRLPTEEIEGVIHTVIRELGTPSLADLGKVMGRVMAEFKGKNVEGSLVSTLVKQKLSA